MYSEEAVLVPRPARGVGHVLFFWPLAGFLERSWFDALFVFGGLVSMNRVKWKCPGCQKIYSVPKDSQYTSCKECQSRSPFNSEITDATPNSLKFSKTKRSYSSQNAWRLRRLVFVAVSFAATLGIILTIISLQIVPSSPNPLPIVERNPDSPLPDKSAAKNEAPVAQNIHETKTSLRFSVKSIEKPGRTQEIFFPSPRGFDHSFEFQTTKVADVVCHSLLSTTVADGDRALFFVDLAVNTKTQETCSVGYFRMLAYSVKWNRLSPPKVTVFADQKSTRLECERDEELIVAKFTLAEFAAFLSSRHIEIQVGPLRFKLDSRHLEGMRDLASHLPAGKTFDGGYLITHQLDAPPPSEKHFSNETQEKQAIELARARVLMEMNTSIAKIDSAKREMKKAVIADDREAIRECRRAISDLQSQLKEFMVSPVCGNSLNPATLKTGQMGVLFVRKLTITQIIDPLIGEMLLSCRHENKLLTFKVRGADVRNAVTGADFIPDNSNFVVTGTYTYETVSGGSNTVFELCKIDPDKLLTDRELRLIDEAIVFNGEIELTAEEADKQKATQEANSRMEDEQNRLSKIRRSRSFLESAKTLMKSNPTGARKFLEKSVEESPESAPAKEAAKLLETLPK